MTLDKRIKLFLFTVFPITYISWGLAGIISHNNLESQLILPLHLIGGASPLIATILYLSITKEWKSFFIDFLIFTKYRLVHGLLLFHL